MAWHIIVQRRRGGAKRPAFSRLAGGHHYRIRTASILRAGQVRPGPGQKPPCGYSGTFTRPPAIRWSAGWRPRLSTRPVHIVASLTARSIFSYGPSRAAGKKSKPALDARVAECELAPHTSYLAQFRKSVLIPLQRVKGVFLYSGAAVNTLQCAVLPLPHLRAGQR
jgi:hypothetical protein